MSEKSESWSYIFNNLYALQFAHHLKLLNMLRPIQQCFISVYEIYFKCKLYICGHNDIHVYLLVLSASHFCPKTYTSTQNGSKQEDGWNRHWSANLVAVVVQWQDGLCGTRLASGTLYAPLITPGPAPRRSADNIFHIPYLACCGWRVPSSTTRSRRRDAIIGRSAPPAKSAAARALWGRSASLAAPPSILSSSPRRCPRHNANGDGGGARSRSSLIRINSADVASVAACSQESHRKVEITVPSLRRRRRHNPL